MRTYDDVNLLSAIASLVGHRTGDQKLILSRHVKPLVPATFAVVRTHLFALDPRGTGL
jgi:hypothetical protein